MPASPPGLPLTGILKVSTILVPRNSAAASSPNLAPPTRVKYPSRHEPHPRFGPQNRPGELDSYKSCRRRRICPGCCEKSPLTEKHTAFWPVKIVTLVTGVVLRATGAGKIFLETASTLDDEEYVLATVLIIRSASQTSPRDLKTMPKSDFR
jgi:hypothetical protein